MQHIIAQRRWYYLKGSDSGGGSRGGADSPNFSKKKNAEGRKAGRQAIFSKNPALPPLSSRSGSATGQYPAIENALLTIWWRNDLGN